MVSRGVRWLVLWLVAIAAALAYLRDPPWLIDQASGLRGWEQPIGEPRYRWSGGHASFFVRADAGSFDLPLSTTFDEKDSRPMMVTVSVDDVIAARVVLTQSGWTGAGVTLPAPGSRRVRRIDVQTNVIREDNHGVRIGAPETHRTK